MSAGGLTILRTTGSARAAKAFRWNATLQQWVKTSYSAGAWFTATEPAADSLAELVGVIETARRDPRAFAVRGALAPDTAVAVAQAAAAGREHLIRRRKHTKGGIAPSLVEAARRWLMIDVDNWPLPPWADLADDPEGAIDAAIHELLPPEFHDCECWWQFSSSAGFANGVLKCHLLFWLTEPATNEHIKRVLQQHAPGVDRALFSAAQPHFIADPIIEGAHDPLPRRTGWLRGIEDAVVLPELRPEALPRPIIGTGANSRVGDVMAALTFMGDGEGGEGFHAPLRTAIMRYAKQCARSGHRDDARLKAQLQEAIRAAPRRIDRNVDTYLGDHYLQASIDGAFALLAGSPEIQSIRPHHPPPAGTVDQARAELRRQVAGFVDRALERNEKAKADPELLAEHGALIVGTGLGKTRTAREALPDFIARAKAAGLPHRALWLVPTHRLGNEALADMQALGLNAAVWRGREADQPGTGDPAMDIPAQPMCANLPAVEDALAAGYDVETGACGDGRGVALVCPFRHRCAYQAQKPIAAEADVVIGANPALFHRIAKEIRHDVGLVVADEAFWQAGLRPNQHTDLAPFAEVPLVHPVLRIETTSLGTKRQVADEAGTNDLHALASRLAAALAITKNGDFLSRADVLAAGISAADCTAAVALEWRRKREGLIWPGQQPTQRREALTKAAGNRALPRRAAIWRAVRDLLEGTATHTGRLQVDTIPGKDGPVRTVVLHARAEVRPEILGVPTLLLDATLPVDIVRHYFARLTVLAEIRAAAPHMRVTQLVGGWGKTSLVADDERVDPEENRRRRSLVRQLADYVRANGHGNAAVITYQAIEPAFAAPGIRTAHFNSVAGLDTYGNVRSLFIIGRPMPDPWDTRAAALALTGRPIAVEQPHQETRGVLLPDGGGAGMEIRAYTDPDLEAIRAAISDAEVFQAVGRARGVNRTANDPVDVHVLADVLLPLPVDRLARWEDVRLGPIGRMAARGAVFLSPTDAAKAYPDVFPTADAARMAMQRHTPEGVDQPNISLRKLLPRGMFGCSPLQVRYRPAEPRQKTRVALIASERVAGFRAELEAMVGPLSLYEVTTPTFYPEPDPLPPPEPSTPITVAPTKTRTTPPRPRWTPVHAHEAPTPSPSPSSNVQEPEPHMRV